MGCLALATAATNIASIITLAVLFIWSATQLFSGDQNGEGNGNGENRWRNDEGEWRMDFRPEERVGLKVVLDLILLLFSGGAVFVQSCKVFGSEDVVSDRSNFGNLAGSTFMYANMLIVSFWYMLNLESRENENNNAGGYYNNNNYYNYMPYWAMNEEERLNYIQSVVSYVSIALAVAYFLISFAVYSEGANLPELHEEVEAHASYNNSNARETVLAKQAKAVAHMEMLSLVWNFLSLATIAIFVVLLIVSVFSLMGEEADRMKEEGQIFNLIAILCWLVLVSFGMRAIGNAVVGDERKGGTLGVGMLTGGSMYFALLLFMVFLLYCNPSFEERRREEMPGASIAMAFVCFFLSVMHLSFAIAADRFNESIMSTVWTHEPHGDAYVEENGFVRVEEPRAQIA